MTRGGKQAGKKALCVAIMTSSAWQAFMHFFAFEHVQTVKEHWLKHIMFARTRTDAHANSRLAGQAEATPVSWISMIQQ